MKVLYLEPMEVTLLIATLEDTAEYSREKAIQFDLQKEFTSASAARIGEITALRLVKKLKAL